MSSKHVRKERDEKEKRVWNQNPKPFGWHLVDIIVDVKLQFSSPMKWACNIHTTTGNK